MNDRAYYEKGAAECGVPQHTAEDLVAYIVDGQPPGDFLTAVLANDLLGSFDKADSRNLAAMTNIVKFLYNYAPAGGFGSREAVRYWCERQRKEREARSR